MNIFGELLSTQRTLCKIGGKSKKRVFEILAEAFNTNTSKILSREIYEHLFARERLGSTGLGRGIAIPHCRAESCITPLGVLATLENEIDFNSPDGKPVNLLFALIVPQDVEQDHLDILAEVAKFLINEEFCTKLRNAKDSLELYELSTTWRVSN